MEDDNPTTLQTVGYWLAFLAIALLLGLGLGYAF